MRLSQPFVRRAGERGERRSAAASAAGSGRRGARGEAPGPGRAAERAGSQRAGAPAWAGKSGRTRGATGGDGRSLDRAARAAGRSERAGAAGASGAERVKRAGVAERPRSGGDEAAATRPNGRRAAPDWAESQRDATDRRGARPCTPLHDAAANGRERNEAKRISARKPRPDASRALATRGGRGRRRKRRLPGGASAGKSRPGARHAANRARPPRSIGDRRSVTDSRQPTADSRRPTTDSG
ncbi:hypothetical protein Y029_642 [Burkholderia pseudomallei MSHR303]|nr:hypothetical protein BDL_1919 [Burkholderia pseudomallei MSHR305]AHK66229.1 hypothetical protein BBX_310 [Burkholderia pseudomallei MSHR520]AIP78969.1 hypothetical protein JE55_1710 [Burkholderia pseudomallei]KGW55335.1 hypothetical protein Y029_642 [Burkholderia pseudomallei MSHR303]